jgi:RNA polymerase sigma-70 factor (ECF subfamily)
MNERTDKELALSYLKGDSESFDLLVRRYLQPIYYFCRTMVPGDETNDMVQEVFIKVWKNFKKYDSSKNFKSWLFMIARNTCLDHLRKKQPIFFSEMIKEDDPSSFEESVPDERATVYDHLAKEGVKKEVDLALGKLPPATRVVFELYYREEMTFQEIAEILKLSVNTVKSRHLRGLKALRGYFEGSNAPKLA